jgi:hypothetical protein
MNWYAAHLLMYVKFKTDRQEHYPVWENIILIQAGSDEEAFRKAELRGRADEGDDGGSFRWAGQPAEWVFAGVRKLTPCQDSDQRPGDGTEITFLEMEAASKEDIEKLLDGRAARVTLADQFGAGVEV